MVKVGLGTVTRKPLTTRFVYGSVTPWCVMLGQIVEIEGEGRRLSLERGFLAVAGPDGPLGTVPLDDIEAVILSHPAASLTSQAISALAARGAPLVICGTDFRPAAY